MWGSVSDAERNRFGHRGPGRNFGEPVTLMPYLHGPATMGQFKFENVDFIIER
jgi:hypothetical protein